MNEGAPQQESAEFLREKAIVAYKQFVEQGITSPDSLNSQDPEVVKANELFDQWRTSLDAQAEGNREAEHRANLAKTMFYVDAGFSDKAYLEEVTGWLDSDLQDAQEGGDEPLTALAEEIKAKMEMIKSRLV